ncbi:SIR2 family protein [Leptospira meyeri]|uniref:SIR2 family protein n=1 Tax=Leptospira meyeri TaxID=29508 RepID=UPI000C2986C5|nr:SIR2 family protein [Leptospira meyeri]PJZ79202.1 hypothetical protein CH359_19280 [Leptospira meyeri]PJZ95064.1 hypothetical protein CH358_19110 [Leptospira meyeri]
MNKYTEIAASLCNNSFTLFLGTGFSKHLTNGSAPSWAELLANAAIKIDPSENLANRLFNKDANGKIIDSKFPLLVIAEILEVEFKSNRLNLKEIISSQVKELTSADKVDTSKIQSLKAFFESNPNVNIVTTNYDNILLENLIPNARIFIEGKSISRLPASQNIFHIHGSVLNPDSLILTMSDYHEFIRKNNYFSRKFYTLLQESTVAILGYSLGDFNLNYLFYEVNKTKPKSFQKSDNYYIAREKIDEYYKKYYYNGFGIKVFDETSIDNFFNNLTSEKENAKNILNNVVSLQQVLSKSHNYTDDYLKLRSSFHEILLHASALGIDQSDNLFLELLSKLLDKKIQFTAQSGAWSQYEHLADWLIEIGSSVKIIDSILEAKFKESVSYSFYNTSSELILGKSWEAYTIWRNRLKDLLPDNLNIIKEIIKTKFNDDSYGIHKLLQYVV